MAFKKKADVFVDTDNTYDIKILINLSKELPVFNFDLTSISLEDKNFIHWKLENVRDFIVHYIRVKNVDLNSPILVRSDGVIIDGYHRVIKAILSGEKNLPAKLIPKELLDEAILYDN